MSKPIPNRRSLKLRVSFKRPLIQEGGGIKKTIKKSSTKKQSKGKYSHIKTGQTVTFSNGACAKRLSNGRFRFIKKTSCNTKKVSSPKKKIVSSIKKVKTSKKQSGGTNIPLNSAKKTIIGKYLDDSYLEIRDNLVKVVNDIVMCEIINQNELEFFLDNLNKLLKERLVLMGKLNKGAKQAEIKIQLDDNELKLSKIGINNAKNITEGMIKRLISLLNQKTKKVGQKQYIGSIGINNNSTTIKYAKLHIFFLDIIKEIFKINKAQRKDTDPSQDYSLYIGLIQQVVLYAKSNCVKSSFWGKGKTICSRPKPADQEKIKKHAETYLNTILIDFIQTVDRYVFLYYEELNKKELLEEQRKKRVKGQALNKAFKNIGPLYNINRQEISQSELQKELDDYVYNDKLTSYQLEKDLKTYLRPKIELINEKLKKKQNKTGLEYRDKHFPEMIGKYDDAFMSLVNEIALRPGGKEKNVIQLIDSYIDKSYKYLPYKNRIPGLKNDTIPHWNVANNPYIHHVWVNRINRQMPKQVKLGVVEQELKVEWDKYQKDLLEFNNLKKNRANQPKDDIKILKAWKKYNDLFQEGVKYYPELRILWEIPLVETK